VRDERALSTIPGWLWTLLAATLAAQLGSRSLQIARPSEASELPRAPDARVLRLASFGEPEALARVLALHLQSFGLASDYRRLVGWLGAILELDPRSHYPLFLAARVYAESADPARERLALEFVYQEFLRDPNRRWAALAHAALLAKHRLGDLPLARRYAAAVQRYTTTPDVPLWAKQMEIFILEDMNELEAARIMLGGLLESGTIRDRGELRFLQQRLRELESRLERGAR
jgi:hypothetical protein